MLSRPNVATAVFAFSALAAGVGQEPIVTFQAHRGAFDLAGDGHAAQICVDPKDWPGVIRAARDFQADVKRVTGLDAPFSLTAKPAGRLLVIVGTVGRSAPIDRLAKSGKIDVGPIRGKWEATLTQVVDKPWPGVDRALIIAGSDKRGSIYGVYNLSEQAGVSPWYWWADVPIQKHPSLFVEPGARLQGSPKVKYRGIFLNDEAPALSNWVYQNFGEYKHEFYVHVFELLLRLRANYLWPAMWNNCFSEDDPLNPQLADEYGIVMGTSHVEPMMRADKEWNRKGYTADDWNYLTHPKELESFWTEGVERNKRYENIVTMAMRGKVDTPMSETANIGLLEKIVAAQRKILAEHVNPDLTKVPQLWCLYKEVQEYYEKGMRVPDDVTLLWADDNWGDIRRLPTAEERRRIGGAGVYYHFDYVGGPRNYKWIDTNPIAKVWEQMNLAYHYGADRIWIVNVGDLKPMEYPLSFFMAMAWDPLYWSKERMAGFPRIWATQQFGIEHAGEVGDLITETHRLNGRRKPELVDPTTYSLVNYNEAERVSAEFHSVVDRATKLMSRLPAQEQDAFFQLVLHPAKAPMIVNDMYMAAARNSLYAGQGRNVAAGEEADEVARLFQADIDLTKQYHSINHGKWNHMMDQTHIGYTGWQQPDKNEPPKTLRPAIPKTGALGVAVEGSADAWPARATSLSLPEFDSYNRQHRWFDVFQSGSTPVTYSVTVSEPWIVVDAGRGPESNRRYHVGIDWGRAPYGLTGGQVTVRDAKGNAVSIAVKVRRPRGSAPKGFVEGDGVVSIEAAHFAGRTVVDGVRWEEIPGYGRTLSGMSPFPVTAPSHQPGKGPFLEYRFYVFNPGAAEIDAILGPTLAFQPGHGLRYAISLDGEAPQVVDAAPRYLSPEWETAVKDSVRVTRTKHLLAKPGYHTLRFWMIDPGIVLEKLVVNLGGLRPSYLGPPESFRGG